MRTTTAILLVLALAIPSVARSHPCEAELAAMRKDLDAIRRAVTTIEAVPPGDTRDQMLTGAKARYDLEQRRIKEKQAICDALVAAENPGAVAVPASPPPAPAAGAPPSAPPGAPPEVVPAPARVVTPAPAPALVVTPAPAPVVAPAPVPPPAAAAPIAAPAPVPAAVVAPTVEAVRPAAPLPATPCLAGCGKDTDCKGARICVKGECVDPPEKKR